MKKIWVASGGIVAAALIYFLFIPVFSGRMILDPGIHLSNFALRYYGIFIGLAVLCGHLVARHNAWRFGLSKEEVDRISFWTIIAAVLSARMYFVLFEFSYFSAHPREIIKIWNGGLSIYGALLGGLGFILFWCRNKIYSVKQVLDLAALALPLGQAIGRLGNFFNYEAYGTATNLPWRMFIPFEYRLDQAQAYYHPVFLYEALANLLIFAILMFLRGKVKSGQLALVYLLSYSVLRFAMEFLRLDSVWVSGFRADQAVSVVVFLGALSILISAKRARK